MGVCVSNDAARGTARSANNNSNNGFTAYDIMAFAQMMSNNPTKKRSNVINAKMRNGGLVFTREPPTEQYVSDASKTIPPDVRIFSGCKDTQTSADVSDVSSFGLPIPDPRERAGGACTNSLLHALNNQPAGAPPITFGNLLVQMQQTLKQRKYTQIPQLSSSCATQLQLETFSAWCQKPCRTGRSRALLIGINYTGTEAALNGCINDALMMKDYLLRQGYKGDKESMRMLTDDGRYDGTPTGAEILRGLRWLTEGAKAGDSLFLHYSGHGTQTKDTNGDEVDDMDEAIVPCDYEENGLITDDTLLQLLCGTLPKDVHLVCVYDCCHSGTIMDLPFIFSATPEAVAAIQSGEQLQLAPNPSFNMELAQELVGMIAKGVLNQLLKAALEELDDGTENYDNYNDNNNNNNNNNNGNGRGRRKKGTRNTIKKKRGANSGNSQEDQLAALGSLGTELFSIGQSLLS